MQDNGLRLYRKNIEITLAANTKDYALDKWQNLNGKAIQRLWVPPFNASQIPTVFQAPGAYTTPPESESGKPLAPFEAIAGAYLKLVNMINQQVDDGTPLWKFSGLNFFYWDPSLFPDCPQIDFTQSKVYYPTINIPNANPGSSIMLIIEYWDVWKEGLGGQVNNILSGRQH